MTDRDQQKTDCSCPAEYGRNPACAMHGEPASDPIDRLDLRLKAAIEIRRTMNEGVSPDD